MSKSMRVCVLVASLMSLFGVLSSPAGAITWSNDGGHAFTATAGPATFSGGGLSLICTGATATGTMASSPFVGAVWSAASATATFNGCLIAGTPYPIECRYTLTAVAQTLPVTNGVLDTTCDLSAGQTKLCHFHGALPVHYINPPHARWIVTHSNTLRATHAVGSCLFGGGGVGVTLSQQTFTLTSANPPIITRRP